MSDKPTTLPRFAHDATNPTANLIEPASGKKDVGWDNGEEPPAPLLNWFYSWVYQWLAWINIGYWTRPSLTDNSPVFAFTDRDGNERTYVDSNGYFFGPVFNDTYRWFGSGSAGSSTDDQVSRDGGYLYSSSSSNNNNVLIVDPTSAAQRSLNLQCLNAAISTAAQVHTGSGTSDDLLFGNPNQVVAVCEYRLKVETVGANEVDIHHGFHTDPDQTGTTLNDPTAFQFAMFEKLTGDTNWQCIVGQGTTGTTAGSSVPPVADTYQTFRIEYHGASTPVGVDNSTVAVTRFFIDGAEVAEITTNNPSTAMGFVARNRATSTGPSADLDVNVEDGLRFAWNVVLNPDVPA